MVLEILSNWWRRLKQWRPSGGKADPAWGPEPPVILGVCRHCGAVVLEGWEQQVADGFLCRRCAGGPEPPRNP